MFAPKVKRHTTRRYLLCNTRINLLRPFGNGKKAFFFEIRAFPDAKAKKRLIPLCNTSTCTVHRHHHRQTDRLPFHPSHNTRRKPTERKGVRKGDLFTEKYFEKTTKTEPRKRKINSFFFRNSFAALHVFRSILRISTAQPKPSPTPRFYSACL